MLLFNKLKDGDEFTCAEKAVVDYILKNPKKDVTLSVDELANETFSSPSCVVRLAKKLGMKGYSDFKIKLATELNTLMIDEKRVEVNMPIDEETKQEEVPHIFFKMYYQTLTDVYNSLDVDALLKAVDAIYASDAITMFGVGPSMIAIQDFVFKAQRLRLPVYAYDIRGFENVHRIKNTKNPLTIVVSNDANSQRIRDWIIESNKFDIKIVLITTNEKSPMVKLCDYVIFMDHGEDSIKKLGSFSSRIAASYILDIIFALLFMK